MNALGRVGEETEGEKNESAVTKAKAECILWELVTLCPGSEQKQLDQTSMNEGRTQQRLKPGK